MGIQSVIIKRQSLHKVKRTSEDRGAKVVSGIPQKEKNFVIDSAMAYTQPAGPKDINRLPEGERSKEAKKVWALPQENLKNSDKILIDGKYFLLNSIVKWPEYSDFMATATGELDQETE